MIWLDEIVAAYCQAVVPGVVIAGQSQPRLRPKITMPTNAATITVTPRRIPRAMICAAVELIQTHCDIELGICQHGCTPDLARAPCSHSDAVHTYDRDSAPTQPRGISSVCTQYLRETGSPLLKPPTFLCRPEGPKTENRSNRQMNDATRQNQVIISMTNEAPGYVQKNC